MNFDVYDAALRVSEAQGHSPLSALDADDVAAELHEAETNDRDFSPFERMASSMNELEDDSEEAWEAFDRGIADTFRKSVDAWERAIEQRVSEAGDEYGYDDDGEDLDDDDLDADYCDEGDE